MYLEETFLGVVMTHMKLVAAGMCWIPQSEKLSLYVEDSIWQRLRRVVLARGPEECWLGRTGSRGKLSGARDCTEKTHMFWHVAMKARMEETGGEEGGCCAGL